MNREENVGKLKKIKKAGAQARHDAERAEAAATRAEAALAAIQRATGNPADESAEEHQPAYTGPQGRDALAPAATVS
ncbi:hypothetical protein [Amycolatopsis ultiminotia]